MKKISKVLCTEDINRNIVLRFAVMADAHFTPVNAAKVPQRFAEAMERFYKTAQADKAHNTLDALVFVGDFAEKHKPEEFNMVKDALYKHVKPETRVLACLGNHEYFPENHGGGEPVDSYEAVEYLTECFGIEDLDTSVDINGFRFILNSLRCDVKNGTYWKDTDNIDWIKQKVDEAAAADPKKPIFTFSHIPLKNTVATTFFSGWWFDRGYGAPYEIYKNYSQIVNFTGHDHFPFNFENSIHQKDFTTVVGGHLAIGCAGIDDICFLQTAQCLLVEVDKNNTVTIKRYDVIAKEFLEEDWIIEEPSDRNRFRYTDRVNKYEGLTFDRPDAVTFSEKEDGVQVSIKAIKSDPNIIYYRIGVCKDGQEVKKLLVNSDVWLKDPPDLYVQHVPLEKGTEYTLNVIAVDSFNNKSNTVSKSFKL